MIQTDTMISLRSALLENVEDCSVAAVYADCLDEQGDERRASFWRLVAARHLWPLRSEMRGRWLRYDRDPTGLPIRNVYAPGWVYYDWTCDGLTMSALCPSNLTQELFRRLGKATFRSSKTGTGRGHHVKRFGGAAALLRALLALETAWTMED